MNPENQKGETLPARASPYSLEAEMSVLGAMLLERDTIPRVIEQIDGSFFYKNSHRKIFDAVVKLYDTDTPVDPVTLTEALRKDGVLEEVGGAAYLTTLLNYLPTSAHLDSYLDIVRDKALLRRLISTSTTIVNRCYSQDADPADVLDEVEKEIFELIQGRAKQEISTMRTLVKLAMEKVEHLQQSQGLLTGLPTGFTDIDQITCGLQPSELIVLAGRPSMGKTTLALNIAEEVAVRNSAPVGIFSLEMAKEQLVLRLLCSHARVNSQNLRHGYLSQKDLVKLVNAAGRLSEAPVYIDDTPSVGNLQLRAKARIMKAKYDIKLIIIDYLQLMQATAGRPESRQQEVSDISRSMKALARELEVPVLLLSQLNRGPEDRPDRKPRLSDLRESGAIEQDADLVLLIMRPGVYPDLIEKDPDESHLVYVNVAKQRNGPTGERKLTFQENYTRFENFTEIEEE